MTCTPASGQVFPVGSTPVTCTATDAASQTASCSFQVTVTQTFRLALTKFLAFGDSVTAGEVTVPTSLVGALGHPDAIYQQIVVAAASYPTVLKGKLSQRYTSQTLTVENAGRNGEFAANAFPRFVTTMNASQPEVLLLLMGYNDVSEIKSLKPAISALEQMVVTATGRGVRVALATLTPGIPGRSRSTPVDILLAYNDAIRALAASDGVVLVDLYQAGLPQANSWIGVDGLHPNETGYAGIADAFFAAVQANLEVR